MAGATVTSGICTIEEEAGFYNLLAPTSPQVWLLAAHAVSVGPTGETGIQAKVITGVALDEEFVVQSQEQTGLEHTLIADGRPVISSLTGGVSDRGSVTGFPAEAQTTGIGTPMTFQIDGQPYYATTIPINDLAPVHGFDLEDETALANSYLQQVRERVSIDQLQIKTITVFGRSSATIIGHAKRLNVDLIVMSSRGQSSIRRKLYGSASEKVLCGATCATLFIREQEQIHKDDRIRTMEV